MHLVVGCSKKWHYVDNGHNPEVAVICIRSVDKEDSIFRGVKLQGRCNSFGVDNKSITISI